jgi:hypothetical protein
MNEGKKAGNSEGFLLEERELDGIVGGNNDYAPINYSAGRWDIFALREEESKYSARFQQAKSDETRKYFSHRLYDAMTALKSKFGVNVQYTDEATYWQS